MGTAGINGLSVRVTGNADGGLHIEGNHRGAGAIVGKDDYEYHISIAKADLPQLAQALGCTVDGVKAAFEEQLDAIVLRGERRWLADHAIPNPLWVA